MSDALTDINRDNKINAWMDLNVRPELERYVEDGNAERMIETLLALREKDDIPRYRGYFSRSAYDMLGVMLKDLQNHREQFDSWARGFVK